MREIKFRCWSQKENRMIFSDENDLSDFFYGISDGQYGEVEVEQYTGLKDKLGNEIYTGDILKHSEHGYTEIFEVCYGLGNYDSGVYKFVGFYLKKTNGDDDGYAGYMFDTDYIEVIGNICHAPQKTFE